jgi:hypothetical protein
MEFERSGGLQVAGDSVRVGPREYLTRNLLDEATARKTYLTADWSEQARGAPSVGD